MKRLVIILAILAVASVVFADATGTNCAHSADNDKIAIAKPTFAITNGITLNGPSFDGNTVVVDSIDFLALGSGDDIEVWLYSRKAGSGGAGYYDIGSYVGWGATYGPFGATIGGPGEVRVNVIVNTSVDTLYTYVVGLNCNGVSEPDIQCDDDDVAGTLTYIETGDGDCSMNDYYSEAQANSDDRLHFCLYYTLTPVPTGGASRRRQALPKICEEDDETKPIHMVYCSNCDTHTRL